MKRSISRSRRVPKKEKPGVKSLFTQPDETFYRLPAMEVRSGCVVTDGCRRVLEFTPEKLCLDFGDSIVTFYGVRLRIESLAGKRLVIAGNIRQIDFAQKWGVQNG